MLNASEPAFRFRHAVRPEQLAAAQPGQILFLLRISAEWIRAVKNVTTSEPFFARLPANRRTMPQVLLIEALAQCTGVLCHFSGLSKPHGQTLTFFAARDQCKFTGSAAPADLIVFECHLKRAMRGIVKFSGTGVVGDQPIISMALAAALRDRA